MTNVDFLRRNTPEKVFHGNVWITWITRLIVSSLKARYVITSNKPWQSNFVSLHPFLLDAAEHKIIHCLFIILLFLSCLLIFQRLGGIMAALDDSCNSLQAEESENIFAKVKMYLIVVKLWETFDNHNRCLHKCLSHDVHVTHCWDKEIASY